MCSLILKKKNINIKFYSRNCILKRYFVCHFAILTEMLYDSIVQECVFSFLSSFLIMFMIYDPCSSNGSLVVNMAYICRGTIDSSLKPLHKIVPQIQYNPNSLSTM